MEIVELIYKYINKFINSDELIKEFDNIDLSKYEDNEIKEINQLVLDVKKIKENVPNEVDEVEKKRLEQINHFLDMIEQAKKQEQNDDKVKEFIEKQYNQLLEDKNKVRDGGKLYADLFELLTQNDLVCKYEEAMDNKELLDFITQYISAPLPPEIDQKAFDELVKVGIENDEKESLWRLAFNYNGKNKDFSLIEDYFIEKRDGYYLTELISAVQEDLDMEKLVNKIISTKDKEFIDDVFKRIKNLNLISEEELEKIKF